MRIGTVFGPFEGLFWIDPTTGALTMRQGRKGIAAEVQVQLTPEQTADLLEGLLPSAAPSPRSRRLFSSRPSEASCQRCRSLFAVGSMGRIPKFCPLHRRNRSREEPAA